MISYNSRKLLLSLTLVSSVIAFVAVAINFSKPHNFDKPHEIPISIGIHGSGTISERLMPALISNFLQQNQWYFTSNHFISKDSRAKGTQENEFIASHDEKKSYKINIISLASAEGIKDLTSKPPLCQIGMASAEQVAPDYESVVIGTDGIAIIINNKNNDIYNISLENGKSGIHDITRTQIQQIYGGKTSWAQFHGPNIDAVPQHHSKGSGTRTTFESFFGISKQIEPAKTFNTSIRPQPSFDKMIEYVAATPGTIGYISTERIKYAQKFSSIRILKLDGTLPTYATVKREDYLLTRRLLLYAAPAAEQDAFTRDLLQFVVSDDGQNIVEYIGFANLQIGIDADTPPDYDDSSNLYKSFTREAHRLTTSIRFASAKGNENDTKGIKDIARIARWLANHQSTINKVILLGFTDSQGDSDVNIALSQERASSVNNQLNKELSVIYGSYKDIPYNISTPVVQGFGSICRIVKNDLLPEDQQKNRRVEIWVRLKHKNYSD